MGHRRSKIYTRTGDAGTTGLADGSRVAKERKEGETYFVRERQYGSFTRSFALPDEANPDSVSARLTAGVLNVTIAKKAESKPRKIAIKT